MFEGEQAGLGNPSPLCVTAWVDFGLANDLKE
jgi:hypothetical protein